MTPGRNARAMLKVKKLKMENKSVPKTFKVEDEIDLTLLERSDDDNLRSSKRNVIDKLISP